MAESSGSFLPSLPSLLDHNTYRRAFNALLHAGVPIKAQVLLGVVVVGSSLPALGAPLPEFVFSNKSNPINEYMVKFSWLWTLTFLVPTVLLTAVDSLSLWSACVGHYGRVAVGHVMWFTITLLIELLDDTVGVCTEDSISSAKACVRGGHEWSGFDISGHIFLLTYCIFLITEEAASLKPEVLQTVVPRPWLNTLDPLISYFITGVLQVYAFALMVIWMVMIAATSLYFHTFLEKLIGCVVAVTIWKLTYGVLYGKSDYLPRQPRGSGRGSGRSIMRTGGEGGVQGEDGGSKQVTFEPSLNRNPLKRTPCLDHS